MGGGGGVGVGELGAQNSVLLAALHSRSPLQQLDLVVHYFCVQQEIFSQ